MAACSAARPSACSTRCWATTASAPPRGEAAHRELAWGAAPLTGMRRKVTAAELHDLLGREYAKTAGDLCLKCRLPMPVFRDSKSGPNWRLGAMEECNTLCHTIAQDVAAKLAQRYDLERP